MLNQIIGDYGASDDREQIGLGAGSFAALPDALKETDSASEEGEKLVD
jgi:hypothetical protein